MSGVWELIDGSQGAPPTLRTGVTVDEVLHRLEAGETPSHLVDALHLTPADLISALGHAALGDDRGEGIGLTQALPSRPWLEDALSDSTWRALIPSAPRPARLALVAGLLQVHDFWEASHEAAQQADDLGERAVSAFWHGIAHRREPDSGNASYWFRRVGRHPLFKPLAESARPLLLSSGNPTVGDRLLDGDVWNPFAFIDLCADGNPGPGLVPLAGKLQRREMIALLDMTASALVLHA
jgi:hypothetical protein